MILSAIRIFMPSYVFDHNNDSLPPNQRKNP